MRAADSLARCLLICIAATAPVSPLAGQDALDCSRDWLCIERLRDGSDEILSVRNLRAWPATLTLKLVGGFRNAAPAAERTMTITGGAQEVLIRAATSSGAMVRYEWDWTPGSLAVQHDDAYVYRLPYAVGTSFRILQGFGARFSHTGREQYAVDFAMPIGTAVHAAREGVVVLLEDSHDRGCWDPACVDDANYLVVLHDDGSTGEYYHLARDGVLVAVGQHVTRGQRIALSGNTGHSTMPHLHFAVYRAAAWGRTQSLPFRFAAMQGIIDRPRHGMRLVAVE